jgi:hypothetical protein
LFVRLFVPLPSHLAHLNHVVRVAAVAAGVGAQVIGMAALCIVFSALGFLNPANRGSLMIALLLLFLLMGIVAGYVSARTHKARSLCL